MDIHSQLKTLDFVVIAAYIVALLAIGIVVSVRRRHEDDQFLAGRSFGWFNVGLSIFGTNVNPSFLIGSAAGAYTMGMVTANFEWLAWPFLMLLAMVFAPHYLNMRISTMPEFVRRRFGPHAAEFLSWYALLSTVVSWLGATLFVGSLLLSQIMDWPLWVSAVALMSVATFLTVAGGLAVVIVTDSFQAILMIIGATALAAIGFNHVGGLDQLLEAVPADRWALLRPANDPDFPWHAMLLGYPVIGIWFWCTDQTIVQRVLGARSLTQSQRGALFTGFLKTITPFIFIMPGIFCFVLHPDLEDPNTAFMTMVSNYLPAGMVGLIIAVLIAALVSTIDSGLNSFSTIFTLDIYVRRFRPDASPRHIKTVGRLTTVVTAIAAIGLALALKRSERDLFSLLQSIIGYFAPPMAAVFLIGVLWRRATATAALLTLVIGSAASLTIGFMDIFHFPSKDYWPHFLLMAFYLFAGMCAFMIVMSLLTRHAACEEPLPTPAEAYRASGTRTRGVWLGWALLGAIMLGIYVLFD